MKLLLVFFLLPLITSFQGMTDMERKLTGGNARTWKLNETRKQCSPPEMVFSFQGYEYQAISCRNLQSENGTWQLELNEDDENILVVDCGSKEGPMTYFLEIYQEKQRYVMRLRIKGANLRDETIDFIYYAVQ